MDRSCFRLNWSTASKSWLNGNVPLMGTNVLVPGNPSGGKFPETNSAMGAECKDLVVQPGARIFVPTNNTLSVNGNIINNAGVNGLVIKSDNTGMGSLLHSNPGVNATVEQYLTSERWHLVSPPISNAQISAYFDIYLKAYNEPTDTWTYLVEPTTIPMNATQGYSAWASDNYTGSTTVSYSGTLNTGNYTLNPLSYTLASPNTGWNLIGNPYPSALQWNNTWIKTNVGDWACVHNNGNDECYNAATGTGWPNAGDMANGVIPVSQGFWVRATAAGASLTIPQSERLHSSQPFYKNSLVNIENSIRLRVDGNGDFDVVLFQFTSKAKEGFDGNFDLEKRWGYAESPNIYSIVAENELYSVDVRPVLDGDRVLPIGLEVGVNGLYTIEAAELGGFISGDNVILEDIREGEFMVLAQGTIYNFDANVEDDFHRFNLHIQKSSNQVLTEDSKNIRIYSYGNTIYIKSDFEKIEQVLIYDLLGHEVFRDDKLYSDVSRIQLTTKKGYYFIKVRTGNNYYTEKVYIK
ncbi:MAG: T9SS type A sorting domain-containing protein [Bacteroidales bacterium]